MKKTVYIIAVALAMLLCGCGEITALRPPAATIDPYAGMVQVESGYGTKMWIKERKDVSVNPLRDSDVADAAEIVDENGVHYELRTGVDVSEHQGTIDWALAAADGVDFALLRAAYRGYGEAGTLMQDACFRDNVTGAAENGVDIGVYFFSQATSAAEAEEEADFLMDLLNLYVPGTFSLPVFFDWEHINIEPARTDHVSDETLTDCAVAFCERIRAAGYDAGIYAYRYLAYYNYDLPRLAEYPLWIGAVGERPDFYYAFDIWQFSTEGEIGGITGAVDVDAIFVPLESTQNEMSAQEARYIEASDIQTN